MRRATAERDGLLPEADGRGGVRYPRLRRTTVVHQSRGRLCLCAHRYYRTHRFLARRIETAHRGVISTPLEVAVQTAFGRFALAGVVGIVTRGRATRSIVYHVRADRVSSCTPVCSAGARACASAAGCLPDIDAASGTQAHHLIVRYIMVHHLMVRCI